MIRSTQFVSTLWLAGLLATGAAASADARKVPHPLPAPQVPANLEVPDGYHVDRLAYAAGTQNQICLPGASETGLVWSFLGPQATLFDRHGEQVATHFLSGNPEEDGIARPTWQHSRDTSAVWAKPVASSTDPEFVEAGAVPWLLLEVVGSAAGPEDGTRLSETSYIQRIDTAGGLTPAGGCTPLGAKKFVPYSAVYVFYQAD